MVILLIILISVVILLITSVYFAAKVVFPKRFGVEETFEIEKENGKIDEELYIEGKGLKSACFSPGQQI